MQTEQPEHPRRVGAERRVRPRQHGPHLATWVAGIQRVQARLAQLRGQRRQRKRRLLGPGRRDGQRQRQSGTRGHDLVTASGSAITRSAPSRRTSSSQASSAENRSSVSGWAPWAATKRREPVAAGDDDHGRRAAGQQRTHLIGVAGVVQQNQHAPARQQAAVQGNLRLRIHRHALRGHTEDLEEYTHRLGRMTSPDRPGSKPRRSTYNCPSGNRSATRWAQRSASAVFPTPAVPDTAEITAAVGSAAALARIPSSRARCSPRPTNPRTSGGS